MNTLTLIRPDDWHCHFRDDEFLSRTVADAAVRFGRAIAMPNLATPITTVAAARAYRERILAHVPAGYAFAPLMTLYLNETVTPETLQEGRSSEVITACKLYPAGATTHSAAGVARLENIYPLLERMEALDLPLLIHGESVTPGVDIFDREARFIDEELQPLLRRFPALRVVLEHISTRTAVDFVREADAPLAATITAHHLWYNRNALFTGGIHPHYYCMPILKRREDQEALVQAAISGNPRFFLGTDSAPHPQSRKESACGCAGIYTAHAAIEIYAQIFAQHQALDRLENFASIHGAQFYRLPVNRDQIILAQSPWQAPLHLPFGNATLVPMLAGETLDWQIK